MGPMRPLLSLALATGLSAGFALAPSPAAAQEGRVLVTVSGVPITSFDIPQRQRLLQLREHRSVTAQQALEDLINDRIKFAEARRFRVEATEAQVNAAYAQVAQRSGIDPRGFDQVLRSQGIEPRVYKGKLRADLSWSNIVAARYGRTIFVTDTQLADGLARRRASADKPMEYNFRSIVLLVPATAAPAVVQRRLAEANALRGRFNSCATDLEQVNRIPDAAVRDQVRRLSTDLSPEFRRVLDQTPAGKLTPPSRSQQGIELIAICSKNEVRADDTAARNQVREEMTTTEMQRIARDYLARLRRTAVITYHNGAGPGRTGH
ncbi:peptidylprolyl isomerase [Phreatobacter sp. AB_2022a]|uniref:peptidylprolyl isomerase n=1 Tax=Phreatobacter sp. AB_2022a TaxID=3003134 RepID=UPI00228759BF|nr:SurA N-terminal domain-containing protein [Phreatobacter sp. AB_2022a]MCZ0734056.1 SurA N-terminal domain-containing protein [Phreatobacter sp. AB_2022a]